MLQVPRDMFVVTDESWHGYTMGTGKINAVFAHGPNENKEMCIRDSIEAVRAQTQQSREAIAACEEEIRALAQQRLEKEGATAQNTALGRRLTDEREALGREAARLAEQKEQKDAEYDATAAKLWEEYELTLSAVSYTHLGLSDEPEIWRAKARVLHDTGP